jgi:hypothetical protein
MFIEKYIVQIKDAHGKKSKKVNINANTPYDAHKNALAYCNSLKQDIVKIVDSQNNIVYTLNNGFSDE